MQKVVILSYCFPPCNLTPSERAYSWAKYLNKGNYYPIIITRNWDFEIKNASSDLFKSSGTTLRIEKFEGYEVHYIPYTASWKDNLFSRTTQTKFYFIYLVFALLYALITPLFLKRSSYKGIFNYADHYLSENKDIHKLVATASPFEFFGIAYLLSKKHQIGWIADYRDDWSTSEVIKQSRLKTFLHKYYFSYFEKKWLSTSFAFSSVSEHLVQKIGRFINKPGICMYNGFISENYQEAQVLDNYLSLTYVGSIYPSQPLQYFLDCVIDFIQSNSGKPLRFKVQFIGIKNEPTLYERMVEITKEYSEYFLFTERVSKKEAIRLQKKSHLLLILSHVGIKGSPGSKLYEYLAVKKPVIVFPEKGDIIFETLSKTQQGIFCESRESLIQTLQKRYNAFLDGTMEEELFNEQEINKYTREAQTLKLVSLLNDLPNI